MKKTKAIPFLMPLMKRNPVISGISLLIVVGLLIYSFVSFLNRQHSTMAHGGGFAMDVEAEKVTVQPIEDIVTTVGTVRANESVIIRSEIPGRVKAIHFEEGSMVHEGTLLLTLDDDILKAEVSEAEAHLSLSQGNYERVEKLYKEKFKSPQEQQKASSEYKRDEAILARRKALLGHTKIVAPFSGHLGLRSVSPGDYIKAGDDIVNIENIRPIKVDFKLPEIYVARAKVGQEIKVQTEALSDQEFKGKIFAINPLLDENGRSLSVRAVVENTEKGLLPGMFVSVVIVMQKFNQAVLVPEEAIVPKGNEHYVFKIIDNKAKFTKVEIGLRREGKVQVIQGLSPQDTVVTAGQLKIQDGSDVKVIASQGSPA